MLENTALMRASMRGHPEIARMLLERTDTDINIQNKNGETSLWKASSLGHTAIVRLNLQRKDIDIGLKNTDGHTALSIATIKATTILYIYYKSTSVPTKRMTTKTYFGFELQ